MVSGWADRRRITAGRDHRITWKDFPLVETLSGLCEVAACMPRSRRPNRRPHELRSSNAASTSWNTWPRIRKACALSAVAAELDMPLQRHATGCWPSWCAAATCGRTREPRRLRADHQAGLAGPELPRATRGIVDIAQPLLDRLAAESGELVRLARGRRRRPDLRGQGAGRDARPALRPRHGPRRCSLSCSAAGHALAVDAERRARRWSCVARQGFGQPEDFGPKAPTTRQGAAGLPAGRRASAASA